jgi:hypothetical protein
MHSLASLPKKKFNIFVNKHIKHVRIISSRYIQDDEQKGGMITRDNACNAMNTKIND